MLMHEWIRYRNQQVKRATPEPEEAEAPAEEGPSTLIAEAEPEQQEQAAQQVGAPPVEEAPPLSLADTVPGEAKAEAPGQLEAQVTVAKPAPPAPEAAPAHGPVQAPARAVEQADRERQEVLASLQAELERAGQSTRERLRQLQARQRQLPIEVEEAEEERDEERPRRASETRHELVQRLLDPTLTLREVALLLEVCPTTVRRYTNRGLLNCFRTPGNQRRFHLSDVLDFMERREQGEV
ncbi:MAG: helix-turn-helix domain-containing protein [Armatimonadota bacterium]